MNNHFGFCGLCIGLCVGLFQCRMLEFEGQINTLHFVFCFLNCFCRIVGLLLEMRSKSKYQEVGTRESGGAPRTLRRAREDVEGEGNSGPSGHRR